VPLPKGGWRACAALLGGHVDFVADGSRIFDANIIGNGDMKALIGLLHLARWTPCRIGRDSPRNWAMEKLGQITGVERALCAQRTHAEDVICQTGRMF